jgi:hypothetical protein
MLIAAASTHPDAVASATIVAAIPDPASWVTAMTDPQRRAVLSVLAVQPRLLPVNRLLLAALAGVMPAAVIDQLAARAEAGGGLMIRPGWGFDRAIADHPDALIDWIHRASSSTNLQRLKWAQNLARHRRVPTHRRRLNSDLHHRGPRHHRRAAVPGRLPCPLRQLCTGQPGTRRRDHRLPQPPSRRRTRQRARRAPSHRDAFGDIPYSRNAGTTERRQPRPGRNALARRKPARAGPAAVPRAPNGTPEPNRQRSCGRPAGSRGIAPTRTAGGRTPARTSRM